MLNRPTKEKVFFKRLGKELMLNFITLEDDDWIQSKWDTETLREAFAKPDLSVILLMFWRFLDDESKRIVRDAKLVTWDGMKEIDVKTEDPAEKLKMLISGPVEAKAIVNAMYEIRRKSNADSTDNEKKNLKAGEASATPNSPTSSAPSTGSPRERSD